jgi:hypothetical protein
MKMIWIGMTVLTGFLAAISSVFAGPAGVTYTKDIAPIFEQKCKHCHGADSPTLAEFSANKNKYKMLNKGPRMDSYPHMVQFVGWPDTGAIMRRLDDGKNTKDGKPGNMYINLGTNDEERQKNLGLFKAWVGEGGWVLKKFKDLTREELGKMQVPE